MCKERAATRLGHRASVIRDSRIPKVDRQRHVLVDIAALPPAMTLRRFAIGSDHATDHYEGCSAGRVTAGR
jgi:hypothetical protein